MGTLYIVATPIGNLEDISFRALRILKEVDVLLCEDTRVTRKLLAHYEISTPLESYHQHSDEKKRQYILLQLQEGKRLALVTDSGTPGISDPGNELIQFLLENKPELQIVPIPGPSAAMALASIAGIPMKEFLFLGFPPQKKGRKTFFEKVAQAPYPVMFYESPYRIIKSLNELAKINPSINPRIVVGRELTKQFETVYRGTIEEVINMLEQERRGEFTVLIYQGEKEHGNSW